MTTACNVLMPGGINGDCQIPLSELKNVLVCDKDVSFTYAAKKVLSNWTDLEKQDLTIYGIAGIDSFNNTTDDPNIVTGAVSKQKKVTDTPLPSFELFLESNSCDFKEILNTTKGGVYGVFYELQDGTILGSVDQSGTEIGYFKPFKVRLTANTKLLQESGATTAFRMYVNHMNFNQVYNQFYFNPAWDIEELADAMPVGLNMVKTAVFAADVQTIQVNIRCASSHTGLLLTDFETSATMSSVSTPAVTAFVDNGGGSYDLTVEKSVVPEALVAGDLVVLRVKVLSASDVTHVSGWITVEGV